MDYQSIVSQAIRVGAIQSGLRNCHVKGLYSLVVQPRKTPYDGMLRIFYAGPGCPMGAVYGADGEFILMPHNHRQDVHLIHLAGHVVNVRFNFMAVDLYRTRMRRFFEYRFSSALVDGGLGLEVGRPAALYADVESHILGSDYMHWADCHTVRATPYSIWIVKEGPLAPSDAQSLCYSTRASKRISADDLYQPMGADELADVVVDMRDILAGWRKVA